MVTTAILFRFAKKFREKRSRPKGESRWFTTVTTFVRVSLGSLSPRGMAQDGHASLFGVVGFLRSFSPEVPHPTSYLPVQTITGDQKRYTH